MQLHVSVGRGVHWKLGCVVMATLGVCRRQFWAATPGNAHGGAVEACGAAGGRRAALRPRGWPLAPRREALEHLRATVGRIALGCKSRSMTAIASAGYSRPEQHESQGDQGAWTDIYALSALCHRAVTGEVPVEAPRRTGQLARSQADPQASLAAAGVVGYSSGLLVGLKGPCRKHVHRHRSAPSAAACASRSRVAEVRCPRPRPSGAQRVQRPTRGRTVGRARTVQVAVQAKAEHRDRC